MFHAESARWDSDEMDRFIKFLATVAAAVVAAPAGAQNAIDSSPTPEADVSIVAAGYRASESSGFRLIDHGIWRELKLPAGIVGFVEAEIPKPQRRIKSAVRAGPSGFRRAAYLPHVYAAEARFALPTGLLDALLWTESRYNPFAVSKAGAVGLGQLMPGTAADLGVVNRFDPMTNLAGAARYLRQMLDRFGNVTLALAAYNAGPGAVAQAGGVPRNGETPGYVRDVLRHWRL